MISTKKEFIYNPDFDYLVFNNDKPIRKFIKDEIILFSDVIDKTNRYGITQRRNIIITNKAIYNVEKKDLKRKVDIKVVKGITTSSESDEFVLHCFELDHDYLYISQRKKKIIQFINEVYFDYNNNYMPLCVLELKSLSFVVTLKTEKKKDIEFSKMPTSNRIHVEEYLYGKILSVNNTKPISESNYPDYIVIKHIGRGAYAKVMLVEYIPNGEIYVLKAIRKDYILEYTLIDNVITEKKVLLELDSQFLVKGLAHFQNKQRVFFVMPFIKGGDMYQHLKLNKILDEDK